MAQANILSFPAGVLFEDIIDNAPITGAQPPNQTLLTTVLPERGLYKVVADASSDAPALGPSGCWLQLSMLYATANSRVFARPFVNDQIIFHGEYLTECITPRVDAVRWICMGAPGLGIPAGVIVTLRIAVTYLSIR